MARKHRQVVDEDSQQESNPVATGKSPVIGVQNLFDKHYVGSVAVNAAGTLATAKFYEPAPGRTWIIGLSAATVPW